MPTTTQIASELQHIANSAPTVEDLMTDIVERLQHVSKYNWVGFYMIDRSADGEPMLQLGPYIGAPTTHTRIPLNQGICGAAASSGNTLIVDDVNSDPRYLACSIETKSEIVVPVRVHGEVVGELDIDSHMPAAFTSEDRSLCELAAALVGRYLETSGDAKAERTA
jgi:L-methionine (R)-S-oxide reductase